MKAFFYTLLIIVIICATCVVTCPEKEAHTEALMEVLTDVAEEKIGNEMTEDALSTFQELLSRYPNSIYTADINAKLKEMESHLAGKEMAVGRYYLKHNDFIPAMNRFQTVLLEHPQTNQTPEALYRLIVCYTSLGMNAQAKTMGQLLQHVYPNDKWTQKALKIIQKYQPEIVTNESSKDKKD